MDRALVVLDTETATAQGAPHLVELGAVRVRDGEVEESFGSLVRPEVPIDPAASEVHGITDADVRDAPCAAEVLARFAAWAGGELLAAHNAPVDARVLGFEYARSGLAPPPGRFLDSLRLARRFLPDAPDHTLPTLCQVLELEDGPHHRALPDAVYCWKLLESCRALAGGVAFESLLALCGRPISIPAALPPPPRLPRRLRAIEAARREGRSIELLYGAGVEAPARLEVLPRFLFERRDKGYLEAECRRSGALKTYRLDRVRRVFA